MHVPFENEISVELMNDILKCITYSIHLCLVETSLSWYADMPKRLNCQARLEEVSIMHTSTTINSSPPSSLTQFSLNPFSLLYSPKGCNFKMASTVLWTYNSPISCLKKNLLFPHEICRLHSGLCSSCSASCQDIPELLCNM